MNQHLLALSRDFDGLFELDFGGYPVVFAYSADLVAELCDEARFRKVIRPPLSILRKVVGDGLFTAKSDDKPWGKAHRILMPAFSQRAMKAYFDAMLEVAQQLTTSWEQRVGQDIAVADDMTRLTLDTISLAGFGYRFNSFESSQLHPFLGALMRVLAETMGRLSRPPVLNRLSPDSRQYLSDVAAMSELVDDVIRERRRAPVENGDLLSLMLDTTDPQTGEKLDDLNIRHQMLTFLVAGHETTSGLLTFATYLLLRHPHVLALAYAEVDRVLPGSKTPEYRDLAQMDVIDRILKETLRLWPTAPAFTVAPYEDTTIGGRYPIARNQHIAVVITALHRDPKVWADPDSFDIDRFLPEAEAQRHPHGYKPFGNGQRACIGRQFALTEAKLALALILQKFALTDPHDYRLAIKETLTIKPDRFYIRVKPRLPRERIVAQAAGETSPAQTAPAEAVVRGDGSVFTVLYGSSLGTSRDIAEQIAESAERVGFSVVLDGLDARLDQLPEQGTLVVVTSTYNGKAPDNARATEARLAQGKLSERSHSALRYAVLGVGDSQWPAFQAFPKLIDRALTEIDAVPLVSRGAADAKGDIEPAVDAWLRTLWNAVGASESAHGVRAPRVQVSYQSATQARTRVLPAAARALEVVGNEELVRDPAGLWDFNLEPPRTSTRHLTLRAPAGVEYRTGDHLAVYPRNRHEQAAAVAERLGLELDSVVMLKGDSDRIRHLPLERPLSLEQLLRDFVELQDPVNRKDIRHLAAYTACPHTRGRLEQLAAADYDTEVAAHRLSVEELLQRFAAIQLSLEQFLELCPPLRPRFYSISSAAQVTPDEISLTVGTVAGPAWSGRGEYRGVASAYLQSLRPGDELIAAIHRPDPPFAPPAEPGVPLIMIGPGTGFAPFRGFLQARAAERARGSTVGPSLLFFGCRHPQHDWLYAEEMQQHADSGLTELHLAFSCVPTHPYRYVQDALWGERARVLELLKAGAMIYVCGDGRFMAPAVREQLLRIQQESCGHSAQAASEWLEEMVASGRYRQDIFGTA